MRNIFFKFLFFFIIISIICERHNLCDAFVVQDVKYKTHKKTASIDIETDEAVNYVTYELKNPYRIIIDPLDTGWCDFEDTTYFDEGVIKSIKFVKSKKPQNRKLKEPYYPFDFVSIELKDHSPYKLTEGEDSIILNVGEKMGDKQFNKKLVQFVSSVQTVQQGMKEATTRIGNVSSKKILNTTKSPIRQSRENGSTDIQEITAREDKQKRKKWFDAFFNFLTRKRFPENKTEISKNEPDNKNLLSKSDKKISPRKKGVQERNKTKKRYKKTGKLKNPPPDYSKRPLTLKECIEIAIYNSLSIKIAEERVKLAKLKVNESFRELFPEFNLFWHESKGMISDEHYRGRKVGFEFKQVIFHGGEQMYLWEQAKANLKLAKENLNKAKQELIFDVTKAYYELAKAINKYESQRELYKNIQADFKIAEREYELGLISQIDYLNIESIINQIYHALITYENSLTLAKLELNKAMNIEIDAEVKINSKLDKRKIDIDLDRCIELAKRYKPEYRISYLNSEIAKFGERVAKSQTFPQIDIFGKYLKAMERLEPIPLSLNKYFENERVLGATVSMPFGPHTVDYQKKRVKLAPTVTTYESDTKYETDKLRLSLFDNMARYSSVKEASIKYKEAINELEKAEQELHTDIRESLFSFREAEIKIKNAENNIKLYEKELKTAEVKKGMDEITFFELMQAKVKLYTEKGVYTDALGDYYIALARVNKAIGLGGYFE